MGLDTVLARRPCADISLKYLKVRHIFVMQKAIQAYCNVLNRQKVLHQ